MKSHEMWNRCRSETQRCPRRREFRRQGLLRLAHVSSDSQISYCMVRTFSKLHANVVRQMASMLHSSNSPIRQFIPLA